VTSGCHNNRSDTEESIEKESRNKQIRDGRRKKYGRKTIK